LQTKGKKSNSRHIKHFIRNRTFQKVLIGIVIIAASFAILENGALPRKYRLTLGEKSQYDITAPRDIENTLLTIEMAEKAAEAVPPVMLRLENIPIDVLNTTSEFIKEIENSRESIDKNLQEQGITKKSKNYKETLELEQAIAVDELQVKVRDFGVPLTEEQVKYLVVKAKDEELAEFDKLTRSLVSSIMKEEVNESNLVSKVDFVQSEFQSSELSQEFKNIGSLMAKAFLKPNSVVAKDMTEEKKTEAYNSAMESRQIIPEGSRILSYGDIVTEDKLEVLRELNLIETGSMDYAFASGILAVVLFLTFLVVLYMRVFCRKLLESRKDLILLGVIILLILGSALILNSVNPLLIPVFAAPMLISILMDLRLGIVINLVLALAISFITKGDQGLFYTSVIGGTLSAFLVSGANQRSRLSASGLVIAALNGVIITCINLISKSSGGTMANDAAFIALNGMMSTILTIGSLPFFESIFNIITPLKLLELANPNQPLIKRLLMEAPGTYHHSLMVGNLAEVATEAINGNALLARVGAYYHDVGKLKRPNFFKENQLSENPHDRMTPNLSTLVITSHTSDGAEIAEKYKVPLAVREIISQHHGTTLAAYFYYKAKKGDRADAVKQDDFRYQGPRPSSKEAAVVMLADSVEAAVRSMVDKTEGKMEGLIRKIIKDKLDDGQLDLCDLTLRDLDNIARAFMRVFGGYFHAREEYPEMKTKRLQEDLDAEWAVKAGRDDRPGGTERFERSGEMDKADEANGADGPDGFDKTGRANRAEGPEAGEEQLFAAAGAAAAETEEVSARYGEY
jgi:putative nucleotidyltransferase with HDIG domain